jgi:hypothetical protein
VLDAEPLPLSMILPLAVYGALSAFVWAGTLGRLTGERSFRQSARRHGWRLLRVNAAALLAAASLYATLHPLLFDVALPALSLADAGSRAAIVSRVACYLLFGAALLALVTITEYTRVCMVTATGLDVRGALVTALGLLRRHAGAALTLLGVTTSAFGVLVAGYAAAELLGGSRLGGWRAVALAQAYLVARVLLRVVTAAAQVEIVRSDRASFISPPTPPPPARRSPATR